MRYAPLLLVVSTLVLTACGRADSEATAAAPPAGEAVSIADADPELAPGDVVHVKVREGLANPFAANRKPFVEAGTVVAVDAPFPGGGITGAQLAEVARTWAAGRAIEEIRAKSPELGAVATWSGAITVSDEDNEFYGNYVARDSAGELVVFLEVQVGVGQ